jgi:hypothetical protein
MFISAIAVVCAMIVGHFVQRKTSVAVASLGAGLGAWFATSWAITEIQSRLPEVSVPLWPLLFLLSLAAVTGWLRAAALSGHARK